MKPTEHFLNRHVDKFNNILDGQVCSDIGRSIAEQYIDGWINLHVHVRFHTKEYCAVFDNSIEVPNFRSFGACPNETQILSEASPSEQKVSMLIRITKLMEVPEILPEIVVPRTVARLKRIYDGNYCAGNPFELTPFLSIVPGNVVINGEFVSESGDIPLGQNPLPNEMVKGTPEVIQHFANTQAKGFRHGRHIDEAVDLISRCVIDIFGDSIGFEVTEGRQIRAQSLTLLFGPGKFSKRTFKGDHIEELQKIQKTPKGHEIPIPTRGEFERNLKKVAKPNKQGIVTIN